MDDEDIARILKNFEEMGDKFEIIDEQIDRSIQVSHETLEKAITI